MAVPGPARSPADADRPGRAADAADAADAAGGRRGRRPTGPTGPTVDANLGASVQVAANETDVRWRPSRHARRLLTLAAAGLLLAVVTRRPELAGLAGPALLLLGAGRATRGELPGRLGVRVGLTATRIYEGEPAAVDVAVYDVEELGGNRQLRRPLGADSGQGHRAGQRDRRQRPGRPVHLRDRPLGEAEARLGHPDPA